MAENMMFGYARVSSKDQNETRQITQLMEAGVPERQIFVDKESGKDFERTAYKALVNMLREGDVMFVLSIDRFGRNYEEIKKQWEIITKEKKADIVVLDMPLLDTRKFKDNDLTATFLNDMVLQLLAYVAQKEREAIRKRQEEGFAAAKAKGVKLGRPRVVVDVKAFEEVYAEVESKDRTNESAMRKLGLKRNAYYNLVSEYKNKTGHWGNE